MASTGGIAIQSKCRSPPATTCIQFCLFFKALITRLYPLLRVCDSAEPGICTGCCFYSSGTTCHVIYITAGLVHIADTCTSTVAQLITMVVAFSIKAAFVILQKCIFPIVSAIDNRIQRSLASILCLCSASFLSQLGMNNNRNFTTKNFVTLQSRGLFFTLFCNFLYTFPRR